MLLLNYLSAPVPELSTGEPWGTEPPVDAGMQAAARAWLESAEPLRLGLRAGALMDRVRWFGRLLSLCAPADRERWLADQVAAGQRHPLAASPLHEELDPKLFDVRLPAEARLKLQALWLAIIAPGAVCLDAERRERESDQARDLMRGWLQGSGAA